jgi:tetratricopeptide (TPR) repeat protein
MRHGDISRRSRSRQERSQVPTLERLGPHEWRFPESAWAVSERFYTGCELWEAGQTPAALAIFQDLLQRHPEHLDVRDRLAHIYEAIGQDDRAKALLEEAVTLGRRAFPDAFRSGDLLEWGWLENRPFLRCLCSLGVVYEWEGRLEEALTIYQELLSLNPNDSQGVRALAVTALFALRRPEEVLKVCTAYPDDGMPEVAYGRTLALFQLGRDHDATTTLKEAVRWRPRVATELLKSRHRRPPSSIPGFITLGGADEAYAYWQHNGRFWIETAGALAWVAETRHATGQRRGQQRGPGGQRVRGG